MRRQTVNKSQTKLSKCNGAGATFSGAGVAWGRGAQTNFLGTVKEREARVVRKIIMIKRYAVCFVLKIASKKKKKKMKMKTLAICERPKSS